jgi:hypothetical protein
MLVYNERSTSATADSGEADHLKDQARGLMWVGTAFGSPIFRSTKPFLSPNVVTAVVTARVKLEQSAQPGAIRARGR